MEFQLDVGLVRPHPGAGQRCAAGVSDIGAWNESRSSSKWDAAIAKGTAEAEGFGFNGTPSLVAQGPGGTKTINGFGLSEIQASIQQVS